MNSVALRGGKNINHLALDTCRDGYNFLQGFLGSDTKLLSMQPWHKEKHCLLQEELGYSSHLP